MTTIYVSHSKLKGLIKYCHRILHIMADDIFRLVYLLSRNDDEAVFSNCKGDARPLEKSGRYD